MNFYVKSYLKSVEDVVLELKEGRGGNELGTVVVVDDLDDKENWLYTKTTNSKIALKIHESENWVRVHSL